MSILPNRRVQLILAFWMPSMYLIAVISCLPNIRIQVNNENLQSPPYLLEAVKLDEATQNHTLATGKTRTQQLIPKATTTVQGSGNKSASLMSNINSQNKPIEESDASDEVEPSSFNVVKEETIEEILDLDPESVLKLSHESLINSLSSSDYSRITDPIGSDSSVENDYAQPETIYKQQTSARGPDNTALRFANLPVTSSHQKRPSGAISNIESLTDRVSTDKLGTNLQFPMNYKQKSHVSPSVTVDDAPAVINKKNAPPDTWEPSQIMNGVSNSSQVPATVNREYGTNTRTRITLGGGYVRDRLPPLKVPDEDAPEKPLVPLERPSQKLTNNGLIEESKVIEIPEKIVLPSSVLNPATKISIVADIKPILKALKPDPRCPKTGETTIEHSTACDKYYYCLNGSIEERVCPNGLMYGTHDTVVEYCIHRWKASCDDKTQPNPISSPGCRWQYGIFNVQGSPKCTPDFYECKAGRFEVKKCSIDGQIYDDRTKSCKYAETVGCISEILADFRCPPDDQANTYWPFPRYFLNERALIHCINDKPEIVRCTNDQRVDPEHLHCVSISKLSQNPEFSDRKTRERKKSTS